MEIIRVTYKAPRVYSDLQPLVDEAYGIMAMYASSLDKPNIVVGLFSGGKDSTVASHIASQLPQWEGVAHVRTHTGPASERHSNAVRDLAIKYDWTYAEKSSPDSYPSLVSSFGMPGPAAHKWMYIHLKERAIERLIPQLRGEKKRLIFISGIRRLESNRRHKLNEIFQEKTKRLWWIDPILHWTDEQVLDYLDTFGIVIPDRGHSLDCYCGAFASPLERDLIEATDQEQIEYIREAEKIAAAASAISVIEVRAGYRRKAIPQEFCRWGHGLNNASIPQTKTPMTDICISCRVPKLSMMATPPADDVVK